MELIRGGEDIPVIGEPGCDHELRWQIKLAFPMLAEAEVDYWVSAMRSANDEAERRLDRQVEQIALAPKPEDAT